MQIFFSDNGITATSANHIANMAKEYYEDLTTQLDSVRFYTSEIELITAGKKTTTSTGLTSDSPAFQSIESNLAKIADCKALIAYLREAIKAKETLTLQIDSEKPEGFEFPKPPMMPRKKLSSEIMNEWPLEKLVRYYRLQALAATYGESVHKSGSLSNARKDLFNKLSNPTSVNLNGSETIVSTFTPTIDKQVVDDLFFNIQKQYRSSQAEFNGLESEIKKSIQEQYDAESHQYTIEYQTYQQEQDKATRDLFDWRTKEKQKIEKLKIQIPENLRSIYETINNLSKK